MKRFSLTEADPTAASSEIGGAFTAVLFEKSADAPADIFADFSGVQRYESRRDIPTALGIEVHPMSSVPGTAAQ